MLYYLEYMDSNLMLYYLGFQLQAHVMSTCCVSSVASLFVHFSEFASWMQLYLVVGYACAARRALWLRRCF